MLAGLASWMFNVQSQRTHVQQGPALDLMLCYCCCESLNDLTLLPQFYSAREPATYIACHACWTWFSTLPFCLIICLIDLFIFIHKELPHFKNSYPIVYP